MDLTKAIMRKQIEEKLGILGLGKKLGKSRKTRIAGQPDYHDRLYLKQT